MHCASYVGARHSLSPFYHGFPFGPAFADNEGQIKRVGKKFHSPAQKKRQVGRRRTARRVFNISFFYGTPRVPPRRLLARAVYVHTRCTHCVHNALLLHHSPEGEISGLRTRTQSPCCQAPRGEAERAAANGRTAVASAAAMFAVSRKTVVIFSPKTRRIRHDN